VLLLETMLAFEDKDVLVRALDDQGHRSPAATPVPER
jgi:hypothetical protein